MHKCLGCNSEIPKDIAWCSLICKKRKEAPKRNYGISEYRAEFVVPLQVHAASVPEARKLVAAITKKLKASRMRTSGKSFARVLNQHVRITEVYAIRRVLADEL